MNGDLPKILHELAKLPALLDTIYTDAAKPGVTQAGRALGTVMGLGNTVLLPIAVLNERAKITLERNLEKYRKQIEEIPMEKVCEVPPEIGVPVVEKLGYVADDDLSNLYVNLLAKASTDETSSEAHPSFVNIIGSLSPDEAVLLRELVNAQSIPFLTARYHKASSPEWLSIGDEFLTGLEVKYELKFQKNVAVYLSNYEGLGLLHSRRDIHCIPLTLYDPIEARYRPMIEPFKQHCAERGYPDLQFHKGRLDITPFGRLFANACIKKLNDAKAE